MTVEREELTGFHGGKRGRLKGILGSLHWVLWRVKEGSGIESYMTVIGISLRVLWEKQNLGRCRDLEEDSG